MEIKVAHCIECGGMGVIEEDGEYLDAENMTEPKKVPCDICSGTGHIVEVIT